MLFILQWRKSSSIDLQRTWTLFYITLHGHQFGKAFRQAKQTNSHVFRQTYKQPTDKRRSERAGNDNTDLVCEHPGFELRYYPSPQLILHSHEPSPRQARDRETVLVRHRSKMTDIKTSHYSYEPSRALVLCLWCKP